ncbi:MAG: hypothetical protein NTX33_02610 [Propionibacteriales bacterium]|nr:hypothetical protein [Propionibacteriales bacterium]
MWEQYQPPSEQPTEPVQRVTRRPPVVAGGARSRGAGAVVGLAATVVIVGSGLAIAGSGNDEPDYSGFYDCVAAEEADDPGLLSPADLCEIGNERPPDYVDDYEYDLFEDSGY